MKSAFLTTICVALAKIATAHRGGLVTVRPGQLIQTAIDTAPSGARIIVEAGTYAEQLTISKDGISLIGHNAILVPPTTPIDPSKANLCSGLAGPGTEAGICIQGSNIELAEWSTEHRKVLPGGTLVKDVSVTGFEVRGFSGENIAVVGAKDARVFKNTLTDGKEYGALTVGSKNTKIYKNNVVSLATVKFIGICMDDLSSVEVSDNHISGYRIGLCVQTSGADVHDNEVTNSCVGAFVDPGINGAKLQHNHIGPANPACALDESGSFGVYGIIIAGATNTELRHNHIDGQTDNGREDRLAAGIAVFDFTFVDPPVIASGNIVKHNTLSNNDLDLLVFTEGTGNKIQRNKCTTPGELCTSG